MINEPVDLKALLNQDEEFKRFAEETALAAMMINQDSRAFIASMYAFYQQGFTVQSVVNWIKTMNNINPPTSPEGHSHE